MIEEEEKYIEEIKKELEINVRKLNKLRKINHRAENRIMTNKLEKETVSVNGFSNDPDDDEGYMEKISNNSELHLNEYARNNYSLYLNPDKGILSHFSISGEGENEFYIGLDFGTSCAKAVVKDVNSDQSFAVQFQNAEGIQAYLIPTRIYKSNEGLFSLNSSTGEKLSSIKLWLMNNLGDEMCQMHFVAYLAILLRLIRAWVYKELWDGHGEINWECRIGTPSTLQESSDYDNDVHNLWKKLLILAWHISEQEGDVTHNLILKYLHTECWSWFSGLEPFFGAIPEAAAEADGFLKSHPAQDQQNFTLVDIGSGTVDVSAFCRSESPTNGFTYITPFEMSVKELGTTNCHYRRLDWFISILQKYEPRSVDENKLRFKFLNELCDERMRTLRTPLKNSFREYVRGMTYVSSKISVDLKFQEEIADQIRKVRADCFHNQHLRQNEIKQMPIILCGGGSRSLFYKKAINPRNSKIKNASWLINPIPTNLQPFDIELRGGKISANDYDRLLVAYGLCTGLLRKAEDDRRAENQIRQSLKSYDLQDRYIDKDQV